MPKVLGHFRALRGIVRRVAAGGHIVHDRPGDDQLVREWTSAEDGAVGLLYITRQTRQLDLLPRQYRYTFIVYFSLICIHT